MRLYDEKGLSFMDIAQKLDKIDSMIQGEHEVKDVLSVEVLMANCRGYAGVRRSVRRYPA